MRLADNTGLLYALENAQQVIPCFIFDPRQIERQNQYRSMNALQFMTESLADLDDQIKKLNAKLYLFYGDPAKVVAKLIKQLDLGLVTVNADYTPFSINRDKEIELVCEKHDVIFHTAHDALLNAPGTVVTGSGTPYSVYTAFYKASVKQFPVAQARSIRKPSFFTKAISFAEPHNIYKQISPKKNSHLAEAAGRTKGLAILKKIGSFADYQQTRDIPALPTTHLSAHLKFGTISVREAYWAIRDKLGPAHPTY